MNKGLLLLMLLVFAAGPVLAAAPQTFDDADKQARYDRMLEEMRCLVCRNESLAESPAELAQDLRREVARLIREGKSDAEIRNFLIARYGDYVLYRPPLRAGTVALWFGPFVILLLALAGVAVYLRRRRHAVNMDSELDTAERARLRHLLAKDESP